MSYVDSSIISIVIPAYNYAHTLERAVLSVYNQLDEFTECLVINDGSTDNTADLLDSFNTKYHKLTVISKPNGGLASTRNAGIRTAKGDYLIFLDADDALFPDAIANIRLHLKHNPESKFVIGGHCSITMNGKHKLHLPNPLPNSAYVRLKSYLIDKTISISNGASVMHKAIFVRYCYPEHFKNSEDLSMFAYTLVNFPCSILPQPLANIYKHDDSLRHNVSYAENVGLRLVDEVFSTDRIPEELQALKKEFTVQRLLSLSRVCNEANRHSQCVDFFSQAFVIDKNILFKWSYLKKYMASFLKTLFAQMKR
ncbi:MAG: glycosyltransferase family A protein [Methylophilus sp.]|nr:glycosyltransferase family A protein [Methylophilus sp.]